MLNSTFYLLEPHKCVVHDMWHLGGNDKQDRYRKHKEELQINKNGKNLSNDNKWKNSRLYSLEKRRLL